MFYHSKRSIPRGFSLLEVLISLVIFCIGLLGLAGLQALSLRLSGDSFLRTIAVVQANDMGDRMRANAVATALGVNSPYNNPSRSATANANCLGKNAGGAAANVQCSSTQMAGEDFYEWNASLSGAGATSWYPAISASLPSGSGVVCIDSTPNDGTPGSPACDNLVLVAGKPVFAIKIWWVERKNATASGVTHRYATSFSL